MSGAGDSAQPAIEAAMVPARLLNDGEIVILAIKPHPYFVLLGSWPVIAVCALVAAGAYFAGTGAGRFPTGSVITFAALGATVRVLAAALQWLGRLYVLTNRRLLWVYGTIRLTVTQCPLEQVRQCRVAQSAGERALGLGTILFTISPNCGGGGWMNVNQPHVVQKAVESARKAIGHRPPTPPPTSDSK